MRIVAFLVLLMICGSAYSQIEQPNRYEKIVKFSDDDFTVIPLKGDGLTLIRGTNDYNPGNKRNWELILLDTALHEQWALEFDIDSQCKLIGSDFSKGFVHILFIKNEISGEMRLVTVQLDTKAVTKYDIKPELNYKLTHFNQVGGNFIFGGTLNMEPCVLLYYPSNENLRVMPGFFQKNTELIDVRVNMNQTFNTLVLDKNNPDERKIIFKTFDSSGKALLEDITTINDAVNIQSGISSTLEREDLLVFGTWGKKNTSQSSAFYALPINPFKDEKMNSIYFGKLEHYVDYLKPKKANAVKNKTTECIEQGDIPPFASHVTPYKILEHPHGFLVLAESHTPTSRNNQAGGYAPYRNTPSYYSPYGPYYYPQRSFSPTPYGDNMVNPEEYKKIEGIVLNLDPTGKVQWDFSLSFDDIKVETSGQISEVSLEADTVHLIYKKESELKMKSISITTGESKFSTQKIKLKDTSSEIRSEDKQTGFIQHWTDNSFLVWGYQTIRSFAKDTNRNREIFYVNKIIIH